MRMTKTLAPTVASLLLSAGMISYAQQAPRTRPAAQAQNQQQKDQQEQGESATFKGCLTKGSDAQQYIVADESSGQKVAFAGPAKLDNYVNRTVEVTGQVVERSGQKSFQPQSIKSVAPSCNSADK
jgi:hypothetical protein